MQLRARQRAPAHAAPSTGSRAGSWATVARHVAGLIGWGPLLVGCVCGVGVTWALLLFAGPAETPGVLTMGIRVSFVPVLAGLAFLLHDPHRQLIGALPARAWLTPALRIALAVPIPALSCATQLVIGGRALAADLRAAGQPRAGLPWLAFAAELVAWCLLALALSAGLERTRWHDVAGITAALGALAVVAALALLPLHLLPTAITGMTKAQRGQWTAAWQLWAAVGAVAAAGTGWAVGDPWRRVSAQIARHSPTVSPRLL